MITETARGIILQNGKALLIHRFKGGKEFYTIPGGKVKTGEPPHETVAREVLEETTIVVSEISPIASFYNKDKTKKHWLFLCKYIKGTPKLDEYNEYKLMEKNPNNVFKPMWLPISQIGPVKIHPKPCEAFYKNYVKQEHLA